jgi:hypothetical protein
VIWSSLSRAERATALARHGITIRHLLADLQDVMEHDESALAGAWVRCKTEEDLELLAFEYFGDLGRPQPTQRTEWPLWGRTPDWPDGRLPQAEAPRPRHRQVDEFPMETFEELDRLLAERAANRGLSHEAIARHLSALPPRLAFSRRRVQRAEKVRRLVLEARGWDLPALLKSQGDFRAGDGMWRLPSPERARKTLGLPPAD